MLLLAAAKNNRDVPARQRLRKLYSASPAVLFQRQDHIMSIVMKERWTEADIAALPSGEHDYFDRKSGALLNDPDFRKDMGKAISAFANSGGGHLILGAKDDGSFDGVERLTKKGKTTTRDWLEQIIPNLLVFPLQQFRVHEVEAGDPSNIPMGRVVIAVDVGDSTLAPHQVEDTKVYYYRQAGRSLPAPHFYLETLRNRLITPLLDAELTDVVAQNARSVDSRIFVEFELRFTIKNIGGVAAYKWNLVIDALSGSAEGRSRDYLFDRVKFPPYSGVRHGGISIDPTILPSLSTVETKHLGVFLQGSTKQADLESDIQVLLSSQAEIEYRIVSEFSRGQSKRAIIATYLNVPALARSILAQIDNAHK
jgi:hypothetical protein